MAGKDIMVMSYGELKRLKVVQSVIERHITQHTAATMLGVSERQVRRMARVDRQEKDVGLIHASLGRPSNRRISEEVQGRVLSHYRGRYFGFGPTLAAESFWNVMASRSAMSR